MSHDIEGTGQFSLTPRVRSNNGFLENASSHKPFDVATCMLGGQSRLATLLSSLVARLWVGLQTL